MYKDCWTLQCSCLMKPTWCAKHALCVGLLSRTYFSMWGQELEKCLVKSTIQDGAKVTWHYRQHVKHWVSCDFLFLPFCVLYRSYLDLTCMWGWLWIVDYSANFFYHVCQHCSCQRNIFIYKICNWWLFRDYSSFPWILSYLIS